MQPGDEAYFLREVPDTHQVLAWAAMVAGTSMVAGWMLQWVLGNRTRKG